MNSFKNLVATNHLNRIFVAEKHKEQLPKASIGRSCIRIKHTREIDLDILKKVILEGVAQFDKNGGKM